ncbi:monocarboxylate transporter 9 [Caerostris extrusa]|uniref:Monocarboxylate transporter 9 n=1 Tax=Caerostris extrusa TaxID=172846 RepID=A0AAV4X8M5_CAEEX|nr:monocarboxylate transporter 9 [Caerostris extrusa]
MSYSEGPDRGHAWVIACAACVITMILSGISKMVGILYVAVIDTYGVSRREATFAFHLQKIIEMFSRTYSRHRWPTLWIRAVTLAGAFGASLGAFLAFFAPNVTWLAVCWGGIHGKRSYLSGRSVRQHPLSSGGEPVLREVPLHGLRDRPVRGLHGLRGLLLPHRGPAGGLRAAGHLPGAGRVILHVLPAAILLRSPSWIRNGTPKPTSETTELRKSFKNQPPMYVITDNYVKSNAEKRLSTVSLNPRLLEKNEIVYASSAPAKSHSTTNLVESLEKKLEGEHGYDNLAFAMEKKNNPEKPPLEKRLSIQNMFATSRESLNDKMMGSINNFNGDSTSSKQFSKDNIEKSSIPSKTRVSCRA